MPKHIASRPNDESLVIKISYGATSALLEGDAEKKTEKQVAQENPQADLLKVAHHGSATSTIPELLAAVRPKFAVISVGARNVYGHPRQEVLERLAEAHVLTYRTDMNGAVTFLSRRQNRQLSVGGSSLRAYSAVSSSSGVCRYSSISRLACGGIFLAHQNHGSTTRRAECPVARRAKSDRNQCPRIRAGRAPPWLPTPVRYQTRAPVSRSDSDVLSDVDVESAIIASDQDDLPQLPAARILASAFV